LINLIEWTIYRLFTKAGIAEIAQGKLIRLAWCKLVMFSIDGAHPQTIALQPSDEMPADESSPSAHERRLHRTALDVGISWG
jgi:hypothetical protein